MTLAIATTVNLPFEEAVTTTRDALANQGFGILTEIDIKATMKTKLDEDMENYVILGACNPPLAHGALAVNRQIGLLLPCNVVVRTDPDDPARSIVEAMNPNLMVSVSDEPGLASVANEATAKLSAAITALTSSTPS